MASNEQKFSEAFELYSDELFRHASIRLSDRERALELTQEAFMKTWEYAQKEEVREFRPFLYRTLRHLIIDEYRKHKTLSLEGMLENSENEDLESILPAGEEEALENAINRLDGKAALEKLKELPDAYREVLIYRFVNGFTIKEIAEQLSESENVVSVRIHRGLKKMRTMLEEEKQV